MFSSQLDRNLQYAHKQGQNHRCVGKVRSIRFDVNGLTCDAPEITAFIRNKTAVLVDKKVTQFIKLFGEELSM